MADTVEEQFFIGAMTPAARADPYPPYEAYRGSEPLRGLESLPVRRSQ